MKLKLKHSKKKQEYKGHTVEVEEFIHTTNQKSYTPIIDGDKKPGLQKLRLRDALFGVQRRIDNHKTVIASIKMAIDLPKRKLIQIINSKEKVEELWAYLERYDVERSYDNHRKLINCVSKKLEGGSYVEREWTENEYKTFVKFDF